MTRPIERLSGVYAITSAWPTPELLARAEALLGAGVRILQYRDKSDDAPRRRYEAEALSALCRRFGALFIVNDDPQLAAQCGADGVHLGRGDTALAAAREALGPGAIIGVSCYDDLARARTAVAGGADYVAFGSVFPSTTKPYAPAASLELLGQARRELGVPVVAIGGIDAHRIKAVLSAGANAAAVLSALFDAPDPGAVAGELIARIADIQSHNHG